MPKNGHPNHIREIIPIAIDFFAQNFKLFHGIKVLETKVLCPLYVVERYSFKVFLSST